MSTAKSNSSFDWALVDTAAAPREIAPGITCGDTITTLAQSILELRARVEALEGKYETMRLAILDESFVHDTPEVRLSYRKGIEKKDAEIQRLRTELAHVKQQLTDLQDRINNAADGDEP
jgi:predicted RNase H-like nuclease (RuvC/YqgF family)